MPEKSDQVWSLQLVKPNPIMSPFFAMRSDTAGKYKNIYLAFLLVSLALSYIPGLTSLSIFIYYISFAMLILELIFFEWFIQPVYIYLLLFNPYVIALSLGLVVDIREVYFWMPFFSTQEYLQGFRIGLVSLVGISMAIPPRSNIFKKPEYVTDSQREQMFSKFLIFVLILVGIFQFYYIYQNRDIFLEKYIMEEELAKLDKYIFVTYLDWLIFALILGYSTYNQNWYKSKVYWLFLIYYLAIKSLTGFRYPIAFIMLMLFWQYYRINKITWLGKPLYKIIIFVSVLFGLGYMVILRGTGQSQYAESSIFLQSFVNLFIEFFGGTVNTFYSVRYVQQNMGPPLILPFFDPLLAILPTFIFPEKYELLYYYNWHQLIGMKNYNPFGGVFMPGQIYLFTHSLIGVALFFYLLTRLFHWASWKLVHSSRKIDQVRCLSVLSILLLTGIRTEYWIYVKTVFIFMFIVPLCYLIIEHIVILNKSIILKNPGTFTF